MSTIIMLFAVFVCLIQAIVGFQILYESDFNVDSCVANSLALSMWSINGSPVSCSYQSPCTYYMIQESPAQIILDISTINTYSFISFELLIASTSSTSLDYSIDSSAQTSLSLLPRYYIEDTCSSIPTLNVNFSILSNSLSSSSLSLNIIRPIDADPASTFAIRKLKITANCSVNCVTCLSSTNCSVCLVGFNKVQVPSGDYLCEQTNDCKSVSSCFSCLKDVSGTFLQCTQCLPGNTLTNTGVCTALSSICGTSQYTDQAGDCHSYSNLCVQQAEDGTQHSCDSSIIPSTYLCPDNKSLLIYPNENYQTFTCYCAVTNCSSCSVSATLCEICLDGYYHDIINNFCVPCSDSNCSICTSSATVCTTCKTNYVMNQDTNICELCPSGYYYYSSPSNTYCIPCTDSNCSICASDSCTLCNSNYILNYYSICEACSDGYYYKSSDQTCQPCPTSHCKECTSTACTVCMDNYNLRYFTGTCEDCPDGYYLSHFFQMCFPCYQYNCSRCNSQDCLICDESYFLNSYGDCQQCPSGTFYDSITGSCVDCTDPNCKRCHSADSCYSCKNYYVLNSNTKICEVCLSGTYYSSSSHTCKNCSDVNCIQCSSANFCDVCAANYVLNYYTGYCEECSNGYYYSSVTQSCEKCSDTNCYSCSSDGSVCNSCKTSYVLNPTTGICEQCPQGQYFSNGSCFPCSDANCKICNGPYKCSKCNDQYIVSNQQCIKCSEGFYYSNATCLPCVDVNCKSCSNETTCITCNKNYSLDTVSGLCKAIVCPKKQYRDLDNEICVNCSNRCATCVKTKCLTCDYPNYYLIDASKPFYCKRNGIINAFTMSQNVTSSGYIITLLFQYELTSYNGSYTILDMSIPGATAVSQTVVVSQNTITITKTMTGLSKSKTAEISFNNDIYYDSNGMNTRLFAFPLKDFIELTPALQSASQAVSSAGTVFSDVNTSSFVPIMVLSNFYILVNTIDLTGFLYYLLFINVRLPQNVLNFFNIFKNFQFPFIPNIFTYIISNGYAQQAPKRFMDMNNDAYFINSAGQSITIIIIFLIIYMFIKVLSRFPIPKVQKYLKNSIKNTWEYGSFFDALCSVYIYILTGSLLQFTVYEFDDQSCILNYILHSIWSVISILVPFFILWILFKVKNFKSNKRAQVKLSSLIGGIVLYDSVENYDADIDVKKNQIKPTNGATNELNCQSSDRNMSLPQSIRNGSMNSPQPSTLLRGSSKEIKKQPLTKRQRIAMRTSHLCNGIMYLRKLLFCMIIVYLYDKQYIQLTLISLLNVAIAGYILYVRPYETKGENFKNAAGEVVLIGIQISVATLVKDSPDESEESRFNAGWIIVGLSAFVLLWNTSLLLVEAAKSVFKLITSPCRKKSKVQPSSSLKLENAKEDKEEDIISMQRINGKDQDVHIEVNQFQSQREDHPEGEMSFSKIQPPTVLQNQLLLEKVQGNTNGAGGSSIAGGFSFSDSTLAPTFNVMPSSPLFSQREEHELLDSRKNVNQIREKQQQTIEESLVKAINNQNNEEVHLSSNINNNSPTKFGNNSTHEMVKNHYSPNGSNESDGEVNKAKQEIQQMFNSRVEDLKSQLRLLQPKCTTSQQASRSKSPKKKQFLKKKQLPYLKTTKK